MANDNLRRGLRLHALLGLILTSAQSPREGDEEHEKLRSEPLRDLLNARHEVTVVDESHYVETRPKWQKLAGFGHLGGTPKPKEPQAPPAEPFKRGSFFPAEAVAGKKYNKPRRRR